VLCDLEERTRQEAAAQLGWPEGTVAGRLARGRALLARKLARHGLVIVVGSLGTMLSQNASSARVPAALVESTVKAATMVAAGPAAASAVISARVIGLTEGVLKAMLISSLKTMMATAALVVLGTMALGYGVLAGGQPNGKGQTADKTVARTDDKPKEGEAAKKPPVVGQEVPAQPEKPKEEEPVREREIADRMVLPLITFDEGFEDPNLTLQDMLDILTYRKGVKMTINRKAFDRDEVPDVEKTLIAKQAPIPPMRKTTVGDFLDVVLARVPAKSRAMYVIRDRFVEITTLAAVREELGRKPDDPVLPLVYVRIDKQPLEKALEVLSDRTGMSLVVDPRAAEKAKVPVSAMFKSVPLDSAVRVLADMADLQSVQIDNMLYLTSPENADRLTRQKKTPAAKP